MNESVSNTEIIILHIVIYCQNVKICVMLKNNFEDQKTWKNIINNRITKCQCINILAEIPSVVWKKKFDCQTPYGCNSL